ncbi:metallophosphoesterase family protein [Leptospira fainei]|nr:metallophosphoesterase [Leptospira fainei]
MKLVHLSDLHFPVHLPLSSLKGKMVPGYLNYTLRRKRKYPIHLWESLVEKVLSLNPDGIVISGDITNVAHITEYFGSLEYLRPLLNDKTFMIPGNHDRYTRAAVRGSEPYYERFFGRWMGDPVEGSKGYLRWKKIGSLYLIGLDSNKPLSVLNAYGYVDPNIVRDALAFLRDRQADQYVLVCHHPIWNPPERQESGGHKMRNREEIAELLKGNPPIAYLHGHVHTNWVKIPDKEKPYYVINSASSTRISDARHDCGFHFLEIKNESAKITRFTYSEGMSKFIEAQTISYEEKE